MNKKLLTMILIFILSTTLFACQERTISYNDNEDYFSDERIDWYTSDEWGSSIDGSQIRVGDFDINGTTVQLVESKAAPATFDQIFYNKDGYLEDYRVSADLTINSMPEQDGIYNKFGFYAAYQNEQNFVWVFVHPLAGEQFISVTTMVNGAWETVWRIFTVKDGIDKTVTNNLEVVKIGEDFRVYFNSDLVAAFKADIGEAQFGLMSEAMTYTASNITFEPVTEFDKNTEGFGDSPDEGILASGEYDIVLDTVILTGDNTDSIIFKENDLLEDYVIQATIDYTTLGTNSKIGYVFGYSDEDNYSKAYYMPDDNNLVIDIYTDGVLSAESISLDNIDITNFKFQVFMIDGVGRVYIDDQLAAEFSGLTSQKSYGLFSNNADVEYNGFAASAVTDFPVETWGGSFDGVIPQRGLYSVDDNNISILSTADGGYGNLETVFYRGEEAKVEFNVSTEMYVDSEEGFTSNNKWGYVFYCDVDNYLEVFIIPENDQIYTVAKVGGEFLWPGEGFWHSVYAFDAETDYTTPVKLDVMKVGGLFTITVNDTESFTVDIPAFATFAMQVGFEAQETAPVHFDNLIYTSVAINEIGPEITDLGLEKSFEAGSQAPDFTTYITATDNVDGDITILTSMTDTTNVDMSTIGTFDVVYTITDSDSNTTTYTITFNITAAPIEAWGNSYDGLITSNGLFTADATNVTISATNNGGYGEMEQVFYNGSLPLADFYTEADIHMDSSVVVDVNTKYGFMLYNSPTDYIEIFIIPELNAIYTVSQVDGNFVKLWTAEYTFTEGFDFTTANVFAVEKTGSTIKVFLDDVLVVTINQPEYELLEMQVAFVGEKTAPVYFENFVFQAIGQSEIGPVITETGLQTSFEEGTVAPDFTTYITATDNVDGTITITSEMVDTTNVDMNTIGTFDVTFIVTDSDANVATHTISFNIIPTPTGDWGPSYDGLIVTDEQLYTIDGDNVTIIESLNGGYASMEKIFYNGGDALTNFVVSADMRTDIGVTYTEPQKYGFRLYISADDYFEVFIIPYLNRVSTVIRVDGSWFKLWVTEYDFDESYDYSSSTSLKIEKIGADFYLYLNDEFLTKINIPAYETAEMQVALCGMQIAPVYFENFIYQEVIADTNAPTFDVIPTQTVEAGSQVIDFTTLVINIIDQESGHIFVEEVSYNVIYDTVGTYQVTVKAYDKFGNETTQTFDVEVVDTTGPTFDTINDVTISVNQTDVDWTTYIVNEADNAIGDLVRTEITDNVVYGTAGTYTVTVTLTDALSNSTSQTFNVTVLDNPSPIIANLDQKTVFELGSTAPDFTAYISATDDVDGIITITTNMIDSSALDMNTVGTYDVVFTVTDSDLNTSTLTITITVEDAWGASYDVLIVTDEQLYIVDGNDVTLIDSLYSTYPGMEKIFFNRVEMSSDFIVSADIRTDSGITFTEPQKYGFRLYINANDYFEVFIIPYLNRVSTVIRVDGTWYKLWVTEYEFDNSYDYSNPTSLMIEKNGADFYIYLNDSLISTINIPAYENAEMQVALCGMQIAPVYFENFNYQNTGPILTETGEETVFELGSTLPDFKTYIQASDDVDGAITITAEMIDSSAVDMNIVGTYDVVFTVTDSDGYTTVKTITITVQDAWGDSYDGLIASNNQYSISGDDVTITNTLLGGYGDMEQVYYNLESPVANFTVSADISIDSSVVVDVNTKYGFILYNGLGDYLEIYIIPESNGIYTVSQVGGAWEKLWTLEYTFDPTIDLTTAYNLGVVKSGDTISVYLDDVLAFTYTNAAFDGMVMQVGLIGEKTAPIYFSDFTYEEN